MLIVALTFCTFLPAAVVGVGVWVCGRMQVCTCVPAASPKASCSSGFRVRAESEVLPTLKNESVLTQRAACGQLPVWGFLLLWACWRDVWGQAVWLWEVPLLLLCSSPNTLSYSACPFSFLFTSPPSLLSLRPASLVSLQLLGLNIQR